MINWEAVKVLVEANNEGLEKLDLGANRIREEGAKWLAQGKWPYLTALGLSEAVITDPAA